MPLSLRETLLRVSKKFFRPAQPPTPGASSSLSASDQRASKAKQAFVDTFKAAFEKDFMLVPPLAPAPPVEGQPPPVEPLSLHKVILVLKKWKQVLLYRILKDQATLGGASPTEQPLALYHCSPYLATMRHELPPSILKTSALAGAGSGAAGSSGSSSSVAADLSLKMGGGAAAASSSTATVEIPGQYATCPGQPHPEVHAKLLGFHPRVEMFYRHFAFHRRLCLLGNDGRKYYFVVQTSTPYNTRSDERIMQFHWLMNRLLEKTHMAQRRSIAVAVPVVVPITPRLRLMEDHRLFCSLGEVYDSERHARGLDPDAPVMLTRERCSAAISRARADAAVEAEAALAQHTAAVAAAEAAGQPPPPPYVAPQPLAVNKKIEEYVRKEKLEVLREVTGPGGLVSKQILTQFVHSTLGGEPEMIWAWQHAFAQQLGLSSLLCFVFTCGDRNPGRLVFHKQSARILSADLRPGYGPKGFLENGEEVPFRLSPNLMAALSPFSVDGVLVPTMAAVSHAMVHKKEFIEPFLHLMLRDDILSWQTSKSQTPREMDQKQLERALAERVKRNVQKVMERFMVCAPMLPCDKTPFVSPLHQPNVGGAGGAAAAAAGIGAMADVRATMLVERAAKAEYLAQMSPTWQPWL